MNLSLRRGLSLILLFNVLYEGFVLLRPGSYYFVTSVTDLVEIAGPLVVLAWFFVAVIRARRRRPAWKGKTATLAAVFLAAGALSFVVGDIIWAYFEVLLRKTTPFPSMADAGYLTMYPLVAIGILLLAKQRVSILFRMIALLDGALIMGAVA